MQSTNVALFTAEKHYNKLWLVARQPEGRQQCLPKGQDFSGEKELREAAKGAQLCRAGSKHPAGGALL